MQVLTVASPGAQSQDCIAAALACSKILKELSKEEDTDSLEEMLLLADEFEQRAIGEFLGPRPRAWAQLLMGPPGVLAPSLSAIRVQAVSPGEALLQHCPRLSLLGTRLL